MKCVRAGLRDHRYLSARSTPVFRRKGRSLDRNSSSASSDTRLLVPPNALVAGSWPAPPWRASCRFQRSQVGAHSIHHEVIGVRPLTIHAELALLVKIGRRQHHSRRQFDEGTELRPFSGMFSTKRLPITVLTDASEALSNGALPSIVTVSVVLPMDNGNPAWRAG